MSDAGQHGEYLAPLLGVAAFLHRLTTLAQARPCVVPCRDLLRSLILAKLPDTHVFKVIADADCQAMTTDAGSVPAAIALVRRSGTSGRICWIEAQRRKADPLRLRFPRDLDAPDRIYGVSTDMAKPTSTKARVAPAAKPSAKSTPKAPPLAPKAPLAGRTMAPQAKAAAAKAGPAQGSQAKAAKATPAKPTSSKAPAPSQPVKPTLVTLKHIAAGLGDEHGLAPKEAHGVVTAVFETIIGHLRAGARVRMDGFGVIEVKDRAARSGRNPATGETIQIAASRKLVFRPAKELKATV